MKHWQTILEKKPDHSVDWLLDLQQKGAVEFLQQGFPTRQHENWRHTDVSGIAEQTFGYFEQKDITGLDQLVNKNTLPDCHVIVIVNGEIAPAYSNQYLLDAKIVSELRHKLVTDASLHKLFMQPTNNTFTNLNLALLNNGVFLDVKNTIDKPIQLLFVTTHCEKPAMQHLRNIYRIGEKTQLKLIETYVSGADTVYWNNIVTHVHVGAEAEFDYYKVQKESSQSHHLAQIHIMPQEKSQIKTFNFSLGAKWSRDNVDVKLTHTASNIALNGLYIVAPEQFIDHHTHVEHNALHTQSAEKYKGILFPKAKAVFNGKIKVNAGADKTKAHLINQNLLLEKNAEMNTKPELEIYADDVQCSHGATIGQIEEQALFYCRSRGIEYKEALHILTMAFAEEIVANISDKNIQHYIQAYVNEKLL